MMRTVTFSLTASTLLLLLGNTEGYNARQSPSGWQGHIAWASRSSSVAPARHHRFARSLSPVGGDAGFEHPAETSPSSSTNINVNAGGDLWSRRDACRRLAVAGTTTAALASTGLCIHAGPAVAAAPSDVGDDGTGYIPAVRPTAYRVDSTEPPTLIPLSSARKQVGMLKDLGRGSGTDKDAIVIDSVNLNNVMNKVVLGTIDKVSGLTGSKEDDRRSGPGYASFVCMGVPAATTPADIDLAVSLLGPIVDARNGNRDGNTALGLSFCPLSVQPALDSYSKTGDEAALKVAMQESGVEDRMVDMYLPLFQNARQRSLQLLALSPELPDIATARTKGLQAVNPDRRRAYVADPQGFIALTQEPKYKLYVDRSLLKDFDPIDNDDKPSGFFAERILVHEAGATAAAKYAVDRPESLVVILAPSPDLRYLQGINGRIPRIAAALSDGKTASKITNNAVTTILLNPTAQETLSKSRYLRLEIGTGPDTLQYQTKVADYLWFSSSPKVNLIPRLMNG
jgi:Haem-binding uptake, Tiki superfamily, ChaN